MTIPLKEFSGRKQSSVPSLVFASASPQRFALLRQIGIEPEYSYSPDIKESPSKREHPLSLARRLAKEKAEQAEKIVLSLPGFEKTLILAAGTVVAIGRLIVPKPEDEKGAANCLQLLSGRSHKVFTVICLITEEGHRCYRIVKNRVRFSLLDQQSVDAYIASGEWIGKIGGYALEGRAGAFVQRLVGSYSAVVGLPLAETVSLLHAHRYKVNKE